MDLNRKIRCYLTNSADEAIDVLLASGIKDEDLALAVLEKLWPEEAIYELEDSGDER